MLAQMSPALRVTLTGHMALYARLFRYAHRTRHLLNLHGAIIFLTVPTLLVHHHRPKIRLSHRDDHLNSLL